MDGESKGFSKGVSKGKNNEKLAIAQNLLNQDVDINIISKATNLSIEKLIKLKNS